MSVVALMRVTSLEQLGHSTRVKMNPAYVPEGSDPHYDEIKAFFEATPSGSFEAAIRNEAAAEQFQVGYAYYMSFERAPDKDVHYGRS